MKEETAPQKEKEKILVAELCLELMKLIEARRKKKEPAC